MLSAFSIISSIKETVNYMGTVEFQENTKKKAESSGKTWVNTVSGAAQGLDESLDDKVILKLANKGAKIVGEGAKATAAGFDETTGKTTILSDESIEKIGITIGRAERVNDSITHRFGLFLEFKQDFEGKLTLTAFDDEGLKMDISELVVNEKAGQAKVYLLQFKYFKRGLSGYSILKNKNI